MLCGDSPRILFRLICVLLAVRVRFAVGWYIYCVYLLIDVLEIPLASSTTIKQFHGPLDQHSGETV